MSQDIATTSDLRTVDDIIRKNHLVPCPREKYATNPLPAPSFDSELNYDGDNLALGVESMRRHMTDEGAQIMDGLGDAGYILCGKGYLLEPSTDVEHLIREYVPSTLIIQDKREWDTNRKGFKDDKARFKNVDQMKHYPGVFRLTILKDAHQRQTYHADAAMEMGCHAWVTYYHPRIVSHLAPYVRPEHLIRTYHTVNINDVPKYRPASKRKNLALLSGASGAAYPLRTRLLASCTIGEMPNAGVLPHPGYHARGSNTPEFLRVLSRFKVAICTSSVYGYALRKIIEATACGCRVITDLPTDDVLPFIDGNLTRVPPSISPREVDALASELCESYDDATQADHASFARWYDHLLSGKRLASDIVILRRSYIF